MTTGSSYLSPLCKRDTNGSLNSGLKRSSSTIKTMICGRTWTDQLSSLSLTHTHSHTSCPRQAGWAYFCLPYDLVFSLELKILLASEEVFGRSADCDRVFLADWCSGCLSWGSQSENISFVSCQKTHHMYHITFENSWELVCGFLQPLKFPPSMHLIHFSSDW